jgi:2-oxoisovalerate dehydrogenase E1 component
MKHYGLEIKKDIDESLALANAEPEIEASLTEELNDVYKPFVYEEVKPQQKKKISIDAIRQFKTINGTS